ncbi:hypothetical protein GMSM_20120 [Geomonas sp. Red276]
MRQLAETRARRKSASPLHLLPVITALVLLCIGLVGGAVTTAVSAPLAMSNVRVTSFSLPAYSGSLTVTGIVVTATSRYRVNGYMLTETSFRPSAGASGWRSTSPTSYTFTTAGTKVLYAWARDTAGNVSNSRSGSVIVDLTPPVISSFTAPSTSGSLTVTGISLIATDNVRVTGYLVNESATPPSPTAAGWSGSAPTSYTFATAGNKTLYGWAKDGAGNVSLGRSAAVAITQTGWQLTFSDEFNGSSLDTSTWMTTYPGGIRNYTDSGELQGYADDAFVEGSGLLKIIAARETRTLPDGRTYNYTSGEINNSMVFSQTYGYFEMRASLPSGNGFWPAFWLLPVNGQWPPEIDIMEVLSSSPSILYMSLHYGTSSSPESITETFTGPDLTRTGFHVYAVDWEPGSIVWYLDGEPVYGITGNPNVPAIPMYLIANLAIGGYWGGQPDGNTVFPNYMYLDYIRVWQRVPNGPYQQIPGPSDPIPTRDHALTITTTSLPSTSVGASYHQPLLGTGGTSPYTWSVTTGSLPAGLTLNPSTGVISGVPSSPGTSNFTVQLKDGSGTVIGTALSITVSALPSIAIDAAVSQDLGTTGSTVTSPTLTTSSANELLVAFVTSSSTGSGTNTTVTGVSNNGTPLTWTRAVVTNAQFGTAEIWWAYATGTFSGTVTATLSQNVSSRSLTVLSFTGTAQGADAIGAVAGGSASSGGPTATLVTTRANSWVFGTGNDWTGAVSRTLGTGQTMVHQFVSAATQDTYWVQRQNTTTQAAGTAVIINDTAPTDHMYNLSIVEIRPPSL